MRSFTLFIIIAFAAFMTAGCEDDIEVTFEMPDGEVYDSVSVDEDGQLEGYPMPELEDEYFLGWFTDEERTDRFYFDVDAQFDESATLYADTKPYEEGTLETPLTDELTLDSEDYEGKNFFDDGIGEAELHAPIDGDTSYHTVDEAGDAEVRYLNVDTPESTAEIEPWGKASSDFVREALEEADTIVLEYEPHPEEGHPAEHPTVGRQGTFGRELAYVWADGRLLNLELIEKAFSPASNTAQSQYGEYLRIAEHNAEMSGRRLHGEDDPDYDRDDPEEVSVTDLVEDSDDYLDEFVNVEGVITDVDGNDGFYLSDGDEEIYFFTMDTTTYLIETGNEIRVEEAYLTTWFDDIQLTDFDTDDADLLDEDVELP